MESVQSSTTPAQFAATSMLQFMCLVAWVVLSTTPFQHKNTYFAQFFPSSAILDSVASAACPAFAPGLFEALQAATPPTIAYFKSLPSAEPLDAMSKTSILRTCWVVYLHVLERADSRPRIYVGSATSMGYTAAYARLKQYDDEFMLPRYVKSALDDGYTITRKSLLCWMPQPTVALYPIRRLLFLMLETAFAYMFWAMSLKNADFGMGHICRWDRRTLEYDGLCSHSALNEGTHGDFDMTAEQLEAKAADQKEKFGILKVVNATNHHYKQMATNYDEYIGKAIGRKMKSRALHPEKDGIAEKARKKRIRDEKRYYCDRCDHAFTRAKLLETHLNSPRHKKNMAALQSAADKENEEPEAMDDVQSSIELD